jgi:hypothetical protein
MVVASAVAYLLAQGSGSDILADTTGLLTGITGIPTGTSGILLSGIKASMSSAALKLRRVRVIQDRLKTGSNDTRRGQSYDAAGSHDFKEAGFGNFAKDYRDSCSRGLGDGFRR